jgi:hypothetical protein
MVERVALRRVSDRAFTAQSPRPRPRPLHRHSLAAGPTKTSSATLPTISPSPPLARVCVAASQHARKVLKTRVGLAVGEFILFDDQEYDLKVNFLGNAQRRAMRPLGLNALDLFSACSFAYGLKPTLSHEDGAKQKLREIDMMWFVVHVLTAFGSIPTPAPP